MRIKAKPRRRTANVALAIAAYRPEDYPRLLEMADDAGKLAPTWEDWRREADRVKATLARQGIHAVELLLDLDDLARYCQREGLPNNGAARAQDASAKQGEIAAGWPRETRGPALR